MVTPGGVSQRQAPYAVGRDRTLAEDPQRRRRRHVGGVAGAAGRRQPGAAEDAVGGVERPAADVAGGVGGRRCRCRPSPCRRRAPASRRAAGRPARSRRQGRRIGDPFGVGASGGRSASWTAPVVTAPDTARARFDANPSRRPSQHAATAPPARAAAVGFPAVNAAIFSEDALASTDRLWADAVAHLSRKLGRVTPLDPGSGAGRPGRRDRLPRRVGRRRRPLVAGRGRPLLRGPRAGLPAARPGAERRPAPHPEPGPGDGRLVARPAGGGAGRHPLPGPGPAVRPRRRSIPAPGAAARARRRAGHGARPTRWSSRPRRPRCSRPRPAARARPARCGPGGEPASSCSPPCRPCSPRAPASCSGWRSATR